jgi:hypothetical protein
VRRLARVLLRQRPEYPWEVVRDGLARLGYEVSFEVRQPAPAELLVTWTPWRGTVVDRYGEAHRAAGGTWLVLENGYLRSAYRGDRYYCLGLNGFNGVGDHRAQGSPADRFLDLSRPALPWRTSGDHILLIGQNGGADHRYTMPAGWLDDVVERLRCLTPRPIHYLPKRQRPQFFQYRHDNVTLREDSLERCLEDAWCAVTYNSKAAVEALLSGIPALYDGQNSAIQACVAPGIQLVERPPTPNRAQLLADLAYAQWSTAELATGRPFARFLT